MKIFAVLRKEKDEVRIPNKWKVFWCKLFKIQIEKKYQFCVVLKMASGDESRQICISDMVQIQGSTENWVVIDLEAKIVTIRNLRPMTDFDIGDELIVVGSVYIE